MLARLKAHAPRMRVLALPFGLVVFLAGCRSHRKPVIAVIPRTTGTTLWEPLQSGTHDADERDGYRTYWNAATREDDVERQIAILEQEEASGIAGLIIAPSQGLALITPLRAAVERGIPTVVVSSGLPIPVQGISYILNDEDFGAELAAERIALIPAPKSIVMMGLNPDISGIMERARSLEALLRARYPGVRITKRRGTFDPVHEQQVAEELLQQDPSISVIVGLMWSSTRGALDAIHQFHRKDVRVIGFDPEGRLPFSSSELDAVIVQDTHTMGEEAVDTIAAVRAGGPTAALRTVRPVLITRENQNAPSVRHFTSYGPAPWLDGDQP